MEKALNMSVPATAESDLVGLNSATPQWFKDCFTRPRTKGTVEVEGTEISYLRWGDSRKPGVVLTHGFMAHARCWAFIAPLLADDYCLVAFDLSGMGDSGWRDNYDITVRAQECLAVAEAAGLTEGPTKPSLVCHSYGASVGLIAVEQNPDAWQSFIVCDMSMLAPGEESPFHERVDNRKARPHRVIEDAAELQARFRLTPDQPCANDYLVDYMAAHSVKPVDGGYVWKFDPQIMGPDEDRDPDWWHSIAPRFVGLDLPRAVIYGEHSEMMSEKVRQYVRETSNNTIAQVGIKDAYHHLMLDQPIGFAAVIDTLLQSFDTEPSKQGAK